MTLPRRFKNFPLHIDVPEEVYAATERDLDKWQNQRFTIGTELCRLINLKTYRYFRGLPKDESVIFVKQDLIDAMFTKREKIMGATILNVGRHLVNSVCYKPVVHIRRKNVKAMGWRFHSPLDVEYGTAKQIGRWMGDFLLTYVRADYPHPNMLTEQTLKKELDLIYEMSDDELYELWIKPEEPEKEDNYLGDPKIIKWKVEGE